MDSPTPQPNRDERPPTPAVSSDRERDGRPGDPEAAPSDAAPGLRTPRAAPPRTRAPSARDAGRLLARSAVAGAVGALIGVALAVLLPSHPPSSSGTDALPPSDVVPPASATRDEALARRRTLEGSEATDTRPDDHTLARRDADRSPARAADAAASRAAGADGVASSDPSPGDRTTDRDGTASPASTAGDPASASR